jgi:hypothetical protein
MARGIHHFITSRGQKVNGNLGEGSSPTVIETDGIAIGSAALAFTCLRLFGAFHRVEVAFAFFFLRVFVILGQRAAARYVPRASQ